MIKPIVHPASNCTGRSGNSHVSKIGLRTYLAKVSAITAFEVGLMISKATQRYRKAGNEPNA